MKKQKKLNIKVRDLDALKNVTGGRRHHRHHKIASAAGWIPNPSGAGKWDY
jgi:hypothetical protein